MLLPGQQEQSPGFEVLSSSLGWRAEEECGRACTLQLCFVNVENRMVAGFLAKVGWEP